MKSQLLHMAFDLEDTWPLILKIDSLNGAGISICIPSSDLKNSGPPKEFWKN